MALPQLDGDLPRIDEQSADDFADPEREEELPGVDEDGGEDGEKLPNASWIRGKSVPSLGRGSLGGSAQTQEILANLHENLHPITQDVAILLGKPRHITTSSLVLYFIHLFNKPNMLRKIMRSE